MKNQIPFNDTVWTKENYKLAHTILHRLQKRDQIQYAAIIEDKVKSMPHEYLKKFFHSLPTKEFQIVPFRVNGLVKNEAELHYSASKDLKQYAFTLYSKHAFATMFVFEMSDTRVQPEPFIQVSIERVYSHKKGYGAKLIQHILKKANQHGMILTMWNENEALKDYFVSQGFDFQYKSLTTGHYFLTKNI